MGILWKEWRQQRAMFLLGTGSGLLFVLFDGFMNWQTIGTFRTDVGVAVVLGFGAICAIVLAVATTYDDARGGTSEFWQSRPIHPAALLGTKLAMGALLLLAAAVVLLLPDLLTNRLLYGWASRSLWQALCFTWVVAVMLFAVSMLLVVLMRDATRAALAAIWLGLLVYCLPLLVNGLGWLSVFEAVSDAPNCPSILLDVALPLLGLDTGSDLSVRALSGPGVAVVRMTLPRILWAVVASPQYANWLLLATVTASVSAGAVLLSVAALRRGWCWRPGQKTVVWTIGLSAAFIFAVAMFQVGHNLESVTHWQGRPIEPRFLLEAPAVTKLDWTQPGGEVSEFPRANDHQWLPFRVEAAQDLLLRASVAMPWVHDNLYPQQSPYDWYLDIYGHPGRAEEQPHLARVRFFRQPTVPTNVSKSIPMLAVRDDRLYLVYQPPMPAEQGKGIQMDGMRIEWTMRMLVADISDPRQPRLVSDRELYRTDGRDGAFIGGSLYTDPDTGVLCYLAASNQLRVLSLEDPTQPQIVRTIATRDLGLADYAIPSANLRINGQLLLCTGHSSVLLLDLADPLAPRVVLYEMLVSDDSEGLGWIVDAIRSDDLLYVQRQRGIEVYRIADYAGPKGQKATGYVAGEGAVGGAGLVRIGQRSATPLERLERHPQGLLLRDDRLYEAAGGFGVLVYDVSDPTRPRRIAHGGEALYVSDVGMWNGLFWATNGRYGEGEVVFLTMPGMDSR